MVSLHTGITGALRDHCKCERGTSFVSDKYNMLFEKEKKRLPSDEGFPLKMSTILKFSYRLFSLSTVHRDAESLSQ